ncbi:hypothetical protein TIFTF001_009801 [Ficus carica]|uniref:Uncharacterized protein n=1 Tax=Ficus carica TaxID=3494 RepID=A0AA87ZNT0_FICCA|nr:hypothetical protein TIFTF001_009801 [Ficus carica]
MVARDDWRCTEAAAAWQHWLELAGARGAVERVASNPAWPEGASTRTETRLVGRVGGTR